MNQRGETFSAFPFLSQHIRNMPLVVNYDIGCQLRSCQGHLTFPDNTVASFDAESCEMGPGERRDRLDDEMSMLIWKNHCKKLKCMSRRHESECFWHELVCDLCKAHGRNKPEDLIEVS
ncbi:hypothetical protein B0H11DRAFT_2264498 [Mycena galericulata]|nr:hypothetical protein B0H11DRAFT_2264498 [Mycena galericulata]